MISLNAVVCRMIQINVLHKLTPLTLVRWDLKLVALNKMLLYGKIVVRI